MKIRCYLDGLIDRGGDNISELFIKEPADTTYRRGAINDNGDSIIRYLSPSAVHQVGLRQNGSWNQSVTDCINNEFIYLNPAETSWLDTSQNVNTPANNNDTVTVNWVKYKNPSWIGHWRRMQDVIRQNKADGLTINYDTIEDEIPLAWPGSYGPYLGRQYAPNKILFGCLNSPFLTDFDLDTLTFTNYTISYPSQMVLASIRSLPNGNILVFVYTSGKTVANSNNYASYVVDPYTRTVVKTIPNAFGMGSTNDAQNCLLMPDGRLFIPPYRVRTYAVIADSISNGGTSVGAYLDPRYNKFGGSILLPDGRYLMVNNHYIQSYIFNPDNNAYSLVTPADDTNYAKSHNGSGILLYNEKCFLNSRTNVQNSIVDPKTLSRIFVGPNQGAAEKGSMCSLLPDGNIIITGAAANKWYHIDGNDYTYTPMTFMDGKNGSYQFFYNNKIYSFSSGATSTLRIISASDGNYGIPFDEEAYFSMWNQTYV